MGKAWDLALPHNQLLVLLAMADHADHEGNNVYPSLGLVAWKTGYSEQQVRRVIRELVKLAILVVVSKTPGRAIKYKINIDAGIMKTAYTPIKMIPLPKSNPLHLDTPDPLQNVTPTPDMPSAKNVVEPSVKPSIEPNTHASSDATPKPNIKRYYFEAVALGVFEVSDFKGLSPASLKRIGLLEKSAKSAIKAHYPDIGDEQGALLISKYCAAEKFKPNLQGQTKFELGLTAFLEKNGAHIPSFLANQTPPPVTSAEPAEYVDPDMVKAAMLAIQEKWNANDKRVAS